jgi:hypothetical protein
MREACLWPCWTDESLVMTWDSVITQALGALLSGTVVAAILGVLFNRRAKALEQQLRIQAERQLAVARSTREWEEAALAKVLGPSVMHMARTRRAFNRWKDQQLFLEMEIIGKSNRAVRDLLLENGHLLPADLIGHAGALVEHYDAWLEEFEDKRRSETPDTKTKFIFVGPKGYGFPHDAEAAFVTKFAELRESLYGAVQRGAAADAVVQHVGLSSSVKAEGSQGNNEQ